MKTPILILKWNYLAQRALAATIHINKCFTLKNVTSDKLSRGRETMDAPNVKHCLILLWLQATGCNTELPVIDTWAMHPYVFYTSSLHMALPMLDQLKR